MKARDGAIKVSLGVSNICTAFKDVTIGSKVTNSIEFCDLLIAAIQNHDTTKDRAPGQHFIVLPEAKRFVSAGDGPKSQNADDYIIRSHREGPKMFLKRSCAGEVNFLAVVVYTREAYIADPDMTPEELETLDPWATHFIVAVIASSGPKGTLTPYRFVHNLAGGNNEYKCPSSFEGKNDSEVADILFDHIYWLENKARDILEYTNGYSTVAD